MNVPLLAEALEGHGSSPTHPWMTEIMSPELAPSPFVPSIVTKINFLPCRGLPPLPPGFFSAWIRVEFGGGWALVWPIVMEIDCMLFFLLLM